MPTKLTPPRWITSDDDISFWNYAVAEVSKGGKNPDYGAAVNVFRTLKQRYETPEAYERLHPAAGEPLIIGAASDSGPLRIVVKNKVHTSESEPILVELSAATKKLIAELPLDNKYFLAGPEGEIEDTTLNEMKALLEKPEKPEAPKEAPKEPKAEKPEAPKEPKEPKPEKPETPEEKLPPVPKEAMVIEVTNADEKAEACAEIARQATFLKEPWGTAGISPADIDSTLEELEGWVESLRSYFNRLRKSVGVKRADISVDELNAASNEEMLASQEYKDLAQQSESGPEQAILSEISQEEGQHAVELQSLIDQRAATGAIMVTVHERSLKAPNSFVEASKDNHAVIAKCFADTYIPSWLKPGASGKFAVVTREGGKVISRKIITVAMQSK